MNTLKEINAAVQNRTLEFVAEAEQEYYRKVEETVLQIQAHPFCKIVLLAGPSGSGKTTTAHILRESLQNKGVESAIVSLDNFYLSTDKMPKNESGEPDFETVYSLDIPCIHRCFEQIMQTGKTVIPVFDFNRKCRAEEGLEIDVTGHKLLIVEGLHALNPVLTNNLPQDGLFKIYISVNSAVYDENGTVLLSSRQLRLCRRLSRDFIYRSSDAAFTLKLWTGVVKGEEKYLYCFKDCANVKLSTFHAFEPSLFAGIVPQLLQDLNPATENFAYAMKTRQALEKFTLLPPEYVPQSSLIREFIQGGKYETQT